MTYGARPTWERTVDPSTFRRTRVVSEEWVVVDGRGGLVGAEAFEARTGQPGDTRRGGVILDGVQERYTRELAEALAAEVTRRAAVDAAVDRETRAAVEALALRLLPAPEWSEQKPRPID